MAKSDRRKKNEWDPEDKDLEELIRKQNPIPFVALNDPVWWEAVAQSINGIDIEFLTKEFGKMKAWLLENAYRMPGSPRGWKRFVRTWLIRAYERERIRK